MLGQNETPYYRNLMRCGKLWECPVCSARITERRREELARLIAAVESSQSATWDKSGREPVPDVALSGRPLFFSLITFTLSHHRGESAESVKARLLESYRAFTSGRAFQSMKAAYRLLESLKALEVTYGDNGWHFHLHLLVVSDTVPNAAWREQLKYALMGRWADSLARFGGHADWTHGVNIVTGGFAVKLYLAKVEADHKWTVADEITKAASKSAKSEQGRTMNRLLYDYLLGDAQAGALWVEGVKALSGHKHLSPSRGFWSLLGRDSEPEIMADSQQAAEEAQTAEDRLMARLSIDEWRLICQRNQRGELLDLAATGDDGVVWRWLSEVMEGGAGDTQDSPDSAPQPPQQADSPAVGYLYTLTRVKLGAVRDMSVTEVGRVMLESPPNELDPHVVIKE